MNSQDNSQDNSRAKYVAYYRVSTQRQGHSGLGLAAQRESVLNYIHPDSICEEFREIETGTNKKRRPQLEEALKVCQQQDAILIVAKLDRLSRNVSFLSSLMDSKVKFKAVDMPDANELTIHIMAAMAQHEAKVISGRVKEALKHSKKRLGNPQNLTNKDRAKGVEVRLHNARSNPNNVRAKAYLQALDASKHTLKDMAQLLNRGGFKTSRGKQFSPVQVSRLLKKLA